MATAPEAEMRFSRREMFLRDEVRTVWAADEGEYIGEKDGLSTYRELPRRRAAESSRRVVGSPVQVGFAG